MRAAAGPRARRKGRSDDAEKRAEIAEDLADNQRRDLAAVGRDLGVHVTRRRDHDPNRVPRGHTRAPDGWPVQATDPTPPRCAEHEALSSDLTQQIGYAVGAGITDDQCAAMKTLYAELAGFEWGNSHEAHLALLLRQREQARVAARLRPAAATGAAALPSPNALAGVDVCTLDARQALAVRSLVRKGHVDSRSLFGLAARFFGQLGSPEVDEYFREARVPTDEDFDAELASRRTDDAVFVISKMLPSSGGALAAERIRPPMTGAEIAEQLTSLAAAPPAGSPTEHMHRGRPSPPAWVTDPQFPEIITKAIDAIETINLGGAGGRAAGKTPESWAEKIVNIFNGRRPRKKLKQSK